MCLKINDLRQALQRVAIVCYQSATHYAGLDAAAPDPKRLGHVTIVLERCISMFRIHTGRVER
jgi:hypothetical protein